MRVKTGADADVLTAATHADRLLVTLDRRLGDKRARPPGPIPGSRCCRVAAQDSQVVTDALPSFLSGGELGDLAGGMVVVRGPLLRVRRPE